MCNNGKPYNAVFQYCATKYVTGFEKTRLPCAIINNYNTEFNYFISFQEGMELHAKILHKSIVFSNQ